MQTDTKGDGPLRALPVPTIDPSHTHYKASDLFNYYKYAADNSVKQGLLLQELGRQEDAIFVYKYAHDMYIYYKAVLEVGKNESDAKVDETADYKSCKETGDREDRDEKYSANAKESKYVDNDDADAKSDQLSLVVTVGGGEKEVKFVDSFSKDINVIIEETLALYNNAVFMQSL